MEIRIKKTNKKINLTKSNFVSRGGEGKIFAKNGVAYKIYDDKKKMIPFSKIQELSRISDPNVIKPENILTNKSGEKIGYSMKYVANTYLLCQIFAKSFRNRHNISNKTVLNLIQKMQSTISHIHSKDILIVDLNEMNFLIDKSFKEIYFIDVDSYQTHNFPATAIMESIRDWSSPNFNQLTDWFSFGIISFHMFCLIHPFKGKHPSLKGLEERMMANIPVFHKDVRYPKSCLSFDVIPQSYKNWYKAMFHEGKRLPPPIDIVEAIIIVQPIQTIIGNEQFDIKETFDYKDEIYEYISVDGIRIAKVRDGNIFVNQKLEFNTNYSYISISPRSNHIICCGIDVSEGLGDGKLRVFNITESKELSCSINAEEIMDYEGRVFIKNKSTISEIDFVETPNNTQVTCVVVANVLEKATKFFHGGVIQNILGSFFISLFPERKNHYQIKMDELNGYQIIEAKYENKVLIIIGSKKGKYDKFIFKFNENYSSYSLRKVENISYVGINFTVLDNGIVVHINEQEEVEVFSNKKDSSKIKIIDNNVINGDMKLYKDGTQVLFSKGNKMYRLKMK